MSGTASAYVVTIDATGIHAPTYDDVLSYVQAQMRGIYGQDLYLENDSQDGQLAALWALAIHDCNSAIVAAYNNFSPATAQGEGLSSVIKINGIRRQVPTRSQVTVFVQGDVGTPINNGIVSDDLQQGSRWRLPALVVIGLDGTVTVTATCDQYGSVKAPPNSITHIVTPTRGWLTVTNPTAAAIGAPVEKDPQLRQRQAVSTALPSRSTADGLLGALENIPGIGRVEVYENNRHFFDYNGIPPNSIAVVAESGDLQSIADTVRLKKGQGAYTYGSIAINSVDVYGISHVINVSRPVQVPINILVRLRPLAGYTSSTGAAIVAALVAYGQGRANNMGAPIYASRLYGPANLDTASGGDTFDIISIKLSSATAPRYVDSAGNLILAWNDAPIYLQDNIVVANVVG